MFQNFTIVYIAGGDEKGDQFTTIIDNQMQFESIEPIYGILPRLAKFSKILCRLIRLL
jgi:hypothetical protein